MLIRAVEPLQGLATMRRRRPHVRRAATLLRARDGWPRRWASPTRTTGYALDRLPFEIYAREETPEIAVGVRIGITKAAELPWRYGLVGSKFLSKPFKAD